MHILPRFDVNTVSIVSLVERTGVHLTKVGSRYTGLCPFHPDRDTPSLIVYPNTNSWCCFGSGCVGKSGKHNGGDQVEWVKQRYKLNYGAAMDWLVVNFRYLPPHQPVEEKAVDPEPVAPGIIKYWHSLLDENNRRSYFHGRGFADAFIDQEMFGWDGQRYTVPVWEWEPGKSACLGVRRRRAGSDGGPKYIGLKGSNAPTVWGRWHCRGRNLIVCFAGELDAARAVQDGIPAFSLVNGVEAFSRFPESWPNLWFPDAKFCAIVFDKKEEVVAGHVADIWGSSKGLMTGRVIHWPADFAGKDYCDFRDVGKSPSDFMNVVTKQLAP